MTQAQRLVYDTIVSLIARNGISPTIREICDATGYASTSTVHKHLKVLRRQGFITFSKGCGRTIRLTACALPPGAAA